MDYAPAVSTLCMFTYRFYNITTGHSCRLCSTQSSAHTSTRLIMRLRWRVSSTVLVTCHVGIIISQFVVVMDTPYGNTEMKIYQI
jgi:hypothetical protein